MGNGKVDQPVCTANGANKKLVLHMRLGCGSLSIKTPLLLMANEFEAHCMDK